MKSYKDLTVWQKSVDLSVITYRITEDFPRSELYGLTSQIRRCSVSIPSNIAEGQRRGHKAEYVQFLRMAFGSGAELETQILIALKIGYLDEKKFNQINELLQEVMKMLNRLISVLVTSKE